MASIPDGAAVSTPEGGAAAVPGGATASTLDGDAVVPAPGGGGTASTPGSGGTGMATIRSWVEMTGVLAAIIGIVILVVQTNELRRQNAVVIESLNQAYRQDAFDKSLTFDEFVIDNAELYAMVTTPYPAPVAQQLRDTIGDPVVRTRADGVATYILDFYDYVLLGYPAETYPRLGEVDLDRPGYLVADGEGFIAWSNAIRGTLRKGSYLCSYYQTNKRSYGASSFVARIDGAQLC